MNQEQRNSDGAAPVVPQDFPATDISRKRHGFSRDDGMFPEEKSVFSRMVSDSHSQQPTFSRCTKIERDCWSYFVAFALCLVSLGTLGFGGCRVTRTDSDVFLGQTRNTSVKKKPNIFSPLISFFKKDDAESSPEDRRILDGSEITLLPGEHVAESENPVSPRPQNRPEIPEFSDGDASRTFSLRETASHEASSKRAPAEVSGSRTPFAGDVLRVRGGDPPALRKLLEDLDGTRETVDLRLAAEVVGELRAVKPGEIPDEVFTYMIRMVRAKLLPDDVSNDVSGDGTNGNRAETTVSGFAGPDVQKKRPLSRIHVAENDVLGYAASSRSQKPVASAPMPEREVPRRDIRFARSESLLPEERRNENDRYDVSAPQSTDRRSDGGDDLEIPHGRFASPPRDSFVRSPNPYREHASEEAGIREFPSVYEQRDPATGDDFSSYRETSYREKDLRNESGSAFYDGVTENGKEWRMHAIAAMNALKTRINLAPSAEAALADEVRVRILESTLGVRREQTRPISGMSEPMQNFLANESFALAMLMNEKDAPELQRRVLSAEPHFLEAGHYLRQNCPLKIRNLQFIKSRTSTEIQPDDFRGFGLYTPIKPEFRPGTPATVYLELENLTYTGNETVHFTSNITWSYEIFDATGTRVLQRERDQGETLRSPRRDVAVAISLELKELPVGHYHVVVRIVDKNSTTQLSMDTQRLSFSVKAAENEAKQTAAE